MPHFPDLAARLKDIPGSVFEKFLPKMRQKGPDLVKLHIGDTYLTPPYALPIDAPFRERHPGFNRYCNTFGVYELRAVLAEKVIEDNGLPASAEDVMLTCGATNALSVAAMSLVQPGEAVMVLTPAWPFFFGMVRVAGGTPVEVPFYTRLYENPELSVGEYLERHLIPEIVALYLNSPNNPSGKVLNRQQLEEIAEFVKRHNLWLISDEAYDGMTYDEHRHISIAGLPGMFERTLSIFTFSKVYMFAGLRLGYLVAPNAVLRNINKVMVHQLYSPSTLAQNMMVEPVKSRKAWGPEFVNHCRELRDLFSDNLRVEHYRPEGAYYLFFSIERYLRGRDYWQVIEECLDVGASVAPGNDFGADFSHYIRICFAGEPPERLEVAVDRLNQVLAGE